MVWFLCRTQCPLTSEYCGHVWSRVGDLSRGGGSEPAQDLTSRPYGRIQVSLSEGSQVRTCQAFLFLSAKLRDQNLHSYATIQLATYSKIAESSTLAHYRVAAIVSYKPTHLHCLPSHPLSKPSIPIGGKSQSV